MPVGRIETAFVVAACVLSAAAVAAVVLQPSPPANAPPSAPPSSAPPAAPQKTIKAPSSSAPAEQKSGDADDATEASKKRIAELRFAEAMLYAKTLKSSMKNPDSFHLELVLRTDDGFYCFTYRGTNSFNAIVPAHALIGHGKALTSDRDPSAFVAAWNRRCTKLSTNMSEVVFAINNGF